MEEQSPVEHVDQTALNRDEDDYYERILEDLADLAEERIKTLRETSSREQSSSSSSQRLTGSKRSVCQVSESRSHSEKLMNFGGESQQISDTVAMKICCTACQ